MVAEADDAVAKTNPPVIKLIWPQGGTKIGSDDFTCRGWLDDFTAKVRATSVNSEATNEFTGLVERNGRFWVEDIPLSKGTNHLTLTVTDAAGNVTRTNISVTWSPINASVDPVTPAEMLWEPQVDLTGTISDPTYAIWINGVKGKNHGDGTWSAKSVPVTAGGVASFDITMYAPDESQPDGSFGN